MLVDKEVEGEVEVVSPVEVASVAVKETVIGLSWLKYPQPYPDAGTSGQVYVQQYGYSDELF